MSSGHHEAAWRLPQSNPFANADLAHWRHLAQVAERATFDSVFLADGPLGTDIGQWVRIAISWGALQPYPDIDRELTLFLGYSPNLEHSC